MVVVVPYDPAWPAQFAAVRADLVAALDAAGARYLAIEHVGSTSVPGLWAKPQLDIDVVVADDGHGVIVPPPAASPTAQADGGSGATRHAWSTAGQGDDDAGAGAGPSALGAAIAALEAAGYENRGELGVAQRHRMRAPRDPRDPAAHAPARNVYVVVDGSIALRNHVGVRDVLRRDAALRDEYAAVQLALVGRAQSGGGGAERRGLGVGEYLAGRNEVVQRILERAGLGEEERRAVLEANRAMAERLMERAARAESGAGK
jgi:GrpB-like predicted nucleotidyltransferase (UPF0157 family)